MAERDEPFRGEARGAKKVSFGKFEFCPETGKLKRQGVTRRLENQPARVLALLLERQGGLVSREECVALLWPGDAHGDFDHRLDKIVAKLRFALGETAARPVCIETVRGRGLRFAGEVDAGPQADAAALEAGHSVDMAYAVVAPHVDADGGRRSKGGWRWATVWICAALVAALAGVWMARRRPVPPSSSGGRTVTVVMLGMRPAEDSGGPDWILQASDLWLSHALQDHSQLRILIDPRVVPTQEAEKAAGGAGSLDRGVLEAVRQRDGGDFAVYGRYAVAMQESGPEVRFDLWRQATDHPERVERASVLGALAEAPALMRQAEEQLMATITPAPAGKYEAGMEEAAMSANEGAERFYAEGLVAAERRDLLGASADLSKAEALDPLHGPAHAALAAVLYEQGDLAGARREYELALNHLRVMTPRQQAELWGLRCRILRDWRTAAKVYGQLATEHPQSLEYRLLLARAEIAEGAPKEALQTLTALPEGQRTGYAAATVALLRANADASLSDYAQQAADAEEAVRDARANDQTLTAAAALVAEGGAEFTLGRWTPAQASWQSALQTFQRWGDRRGMADVMYQQARSEWAKREPVEARRSLERSIALYQEAGNTPGAAAAYALLARVRLYSGADPAQSSAAMRPLLQKARALYRTYGDVQGEGTVEGLEGDAWMSQSNYGEARKAYLHALELSRTSGDQSAVANRLLNLGAIAAEEAEDDTAKQYYVQAMRGSDELGQPDRAALAQNRLANVLYWEGDVDKAVALSEQALQTMDAIGFIDNGVIEDLSRFTGVKDPVRAEALARRSLEASTDLVDPRGLAHRYMVLAEAQLAGGKAEEAKKSMDRAFELKPVLVHRAQAAEMLWARGQVWLRTGKLAEARADFSRAVAISRAFGSKRFEMPARLGLAETEFAEHRAAGRAALEQVKRACAAIGYLLYARQADAVLRSGNYGSGATGPLAD